MAQVVREDENRRPYIESTEGKSANAFRTISLASKALAVLQRRANGKGKLALLFPAPGTRGGTLWRNANFNEHRWQKVKVIAAERGLIKDPNIHGLRHAHANDLIPKVGIEPVSKRIGHANVTVTSVVYSHLTSLRYSSRCLFRSAGVTPSSWESAATGMSPDGVMAMAMAISSGHAMRMRRTARSVPTPSSHSGPTGVGRPP